MDDLVPKTVIGWPGDETKIRDEGFQGPIRQISLTMYATKNSLGDKKGDARKVNGYSIYGVK